MLGFSNYYVSTYLHITHWVGNGSNDGAEADDFRSLASGKKMSEEKFG